MADNTIHTLATEATVIEPLNDRDLCHHDSRCIRIGHNLLEGHPEVVAAELAAIQQKPGSFSSFFQFRFMRRSFQNGQHHVKSLKSVMFNIKDTSQPNDIAKLRQAIKVVGSIMEELIRDEGHVRKNSPHLLKLTVSLKGLGSRV